MYYVTCETDCDLTFVGEFVRELPATRVLHTWCCKAPEEGNFLPKRFVISIPHGVFTRKELLKTKGVVRVRTFDGAKNLVIVNHC